MSERDNIRKVLGKWDGHYGDQILSSLGPDETLLAAGPAAFGGRLMGKDANVLWCHLLCHISKLVMGSHGCSIWTQNLDFERL